MRARGALLLLVVFAVGCGGEEAAEEETTSTIVATEAAPAGPQKWTGLMSSDTKRSGSYPATNTSLWETKLELTVSETGRVAGTGRATMVDLGCGSGYCPDQAETFDFEITGTADDEAFAIRLRTDASRRPEWTGFGSVFTPGSVPRVFEVPKTSPCTAEGRVVTRYNNDKLASEGAGMPVVDRLMSRNTIGLKCAAG